MEEINSCGRSGDTEMAGEGTLSVTTTLTQGFMDDMLVDVDLYNHTTPGGAVGRIADEVPQFVESMRVLDFVDDILQDREEYQALLNVEATLAQSLLDLFQILSLRADLTPRRRASILKAMLRLSKCSGLCPSLLAVDGFEKDGGEPVASGGFCDIWKGRVGTEAVCLKIVRVYRDSDIKKILKESMREAIIWRQLDHPNLLPFHGLYRQGSRICLISPWMAGGSLTQFLRDSYSSVEYETLVWDIASGLSHLHERKIVHADLKGDNILITSHGRACIADFGLSRLVDSQILAISSTGVTAGTVRWTAPEILISGSQHLPERYLRIWLRIHHLPFHDLRNDGAVILHVHLGKRPIRPENAELKDSIWSFIERCWDSEPSRRPLSAHLGNELKDALGGKAVPSPAPDWDQASLSANIWSKLRQDIYDWKDVEGYLERSAMRVGVKHLEDTNSTTQPLAVQLPALLLPTGDPIPLESISDSQIPDEDENALHETGVHPTDVQLVMTKVDCSRARAIEALRECGGALIDAITVVESESNDTGVDPRDVDLVMTQVKCSRGKAIHILRVYGNPSMAIMAASESDAAGVYMGDIDRVLARVQCSRETAVKFIRASGGNLVKAIVAASEFHDSGVDPGDINQAIIAASELHETGVNPGDVKTMMRLFACSKEAAIMALRQSDGDLLEATQQITSWLWQGCARIDL
ncbi:hypothetical protein Moror_3822 [Moniliophthora roreri MCA 2997]|uniref:Protein kinase domain-containing protein n=1 Tax=Moniliophthora roreri (strain MCA 2997) TaxID=1381753 RepID=V2YUM8_MONRO|nr:hypothetical protein Moror_3822 [Moniliophthora roreri MCA 2997]